MFVLYPGLWVKKCEGLSRQSHIFYAWTNTKKESFLFLLLTIDGMCWFIFDSQEKISLDEKSLQIQAKSGDFILNPGLKLFSLCVRVSSLTAFAWSVYETNRCYMRIAFFCFMA